MDDAPEVEEYEEEEEVSSVSDGPPGLGPPYAELWGIATRMAYRSLRDWDESADVAQVVLIAAAKKLKQDPKAFDGTRSNAAWVHSIVAPKLVDRLRASEKRGQPFFEYELDNQRHAVAEWDVEGQAEAAELRSVIRRALRALGPAQRETWILVYLKGLSGEEAAARRGVTLRSHKTNKKLANTAIRRAIARHQKEGE